MILQIEWEKPATLLDATAQNMIYDVNLTKITTRPGIYIFGRQWGNQFEALYVGKANIIRGRVKSHFNNLKLMQHLRNAKAGTRFVLAGKLITKQGQNLEKCLKLAERAFIRHFLSEGHDLVNKSGTRLRRHEVESDGKHPKKFFPRTVFLEKSKDQ